ncbi:MAG: hypothetical protein Q4A52_02745 [Bacillota bacterium]|nr:hypothetical protein [Bacillota bacterium]
MKGATWKRILWRCFLCALAFVALNFLLFLVLSQFTVDPLRIYLGQSFAPTMQEQILLRERLGSNRPFPIPFVLWFLRMLQSDFGGSLLVGGAIAPALGIALLTSLRVMGLGALSSVVLLYLSKLLPYSFRRGLRLALRAIPMMYGGLLLAFSERISPPVSMWAMIVCCTLSFALEVRPPTKRTLRTTIEWRVLRVQPVIIALLPFLEPALGFDGAGDLLYRALHANDTGMIAAIFFVLTPLILILSALTEHMVVFPTEVLHPSHPSLRGGKVGLALYLILFVLALLIPMQKATTIYAVNSLNEGTSVVFQATRGTILQSFGMSLVIVVLLTVFCNLTYNYRLPGWRKLLELSRKIPYLPTLLVVSASMIHADAVPPSSRVTIIQAGIIWIGIALFYEPVARITADIRWSGYYQSACTLGVPPHIRFWAYYLPNALPTLQRVFCSVLLMTMLTETYQSYLGFGMTSFKTIGSLLFYTHDAGFYQNQAWIWVTAGLVFSLLSLSVLLMRRGFGEERIR